MNLKYFIGELYKYPQGGTYRLASVDGFIFRFEGGHWCTDNVFKDLIRLKTGVQVYMDNQLELFS